MGLNFRKSFKIAPGVRLNVGKKGISSVSVGVRGASASFGKKGTRTNVGVPGTGLSYSSFKAHSSKQNIPNVSESYSENSAQRKVSFILMLGILIIPYIFAWFTLREGYSKSSRWISFIWMVIVLIAFT